MLDQVYNKVGSYCKNGSVLSRSAGYNLRKALRSRQLRARKDSIHNVDFSASSFSIATEKGFATLDGFSSLDYTRDVVSIAKSEFSKIDVDKIDWKSKSHLFSGVLENYEIENDSPLIKFALQTKLIAPIIEYFGFAPVLSYVGAWYSPGKQTDHSSSQLFHCDQADVKQMKVFVHCSDISNQDGALNFIDADKSQVLRKQLRYRWDDESQCVPDSVIEKYIPKSSWVAQEGREGTVAFADTSRCFHFGSRLTEKSQERLVMMFQFLSPCAFTLPADATRKLPFSSFDPAGFNMIERQILGIET